MYQIVIDNHTDEKFVIHDSRSNHLKVTNAVCDLELNKTGSLTFKISPTHPYFNDIKKHLSEVYLLQDNEIIFCGRILNDETDIYNFKTIICEGMLGYLLDSIQRAKPYSITNNEKIKTYLTDIIKIHNSQVDKYKQFSVGYITEVDSSETFYKISSYEDTLTTLNKDLINTFRHTYLIPRIHNGKKYLDYLKSSDLPKNNQIIQFGKNLLKFNRTVKGEEIATAIIPLGATVRTDGEDDNKVEYKLDIKDIPDGLIEGTEYIENGNTYGIYKKDDYIYDNGSVKKYGWIFKALTWGDIDNDTKKLVENSVEQLKYYNKLAKNVELNAFDLHLLNANVESFRVGQKVKVYSSLHNLEDNYLIVQKMSININQPDKTTIVLGDEERISIDINNSASKKMDESDKNFNDYDKKFNDYNNKFKDYDNTFNDYDNKLKDYDNKFKNFDPSNYVTNGNFNDKVNDFFNSKTGTGEITDLSRYALITDVQNALDTIANLISGV